MLLKIGSKQIEIKEANTFFKRLKGFMFKKSFSYGIIFPKTSSIHTYFMKENIDVIAVNSQNEIIYKAVNVPKNRIITIKNKKKNTSIIELPANTSKKLKIGEILTFISE